MEDGAFLIHENLFVYAYHFGCTFVVPCTVRSHRIKVI